jgi:hypothetical protein
MPACSAAKKKGDPFPWDLPRGKLQQSGGDIRWCDNLGNTSTAGVGNVPITGSVVCAGNLGVTGRSESPSERGLANQRWYMRATQFRDAYQTAFCAKQKVLCVDDRWDDDPAKLILVPSRPVRGGVYTVREVYRDPSGIEPSVGIRLGEILNPVGLWADGVREASFAIHRFRPTHESQAYGNAILRFLHRFAWSPTFSRAIISPRLSH